MKYKDLLSKNRLAAKEIEKKYSSIDEVDSDGKFKQCSICGFFYQIEDGYSELTVDGSYFEDVCPDCGELLKSNPKINIPFFDEKEKVQEYFEQIIDTRTAEDISYWEYKFDEGFNDYKSC
ncbi:hypothetical protein [Clostridium thermobutyricum]|uniref:hypothetical protein n=1 Tax=Clostridium thermobutyricum TaxID=29372 RepID=UPI0018A914FD|nr:hypothetical protein [Clostridium thermobutyricum]